MSRFIGTIPERFSKTQEVHKQLLPLSGKYRFRMKLHAKRWLIAMCERHHLAFIRTRCHRKIRRARLVKLDNKRMVAPNAKWGRKLLEEPTAIMCYR